MKRGGLSATLRGVGSADFSRRAALRILSGMTLVAALPWAKGIAVRAGDDRTLPPEARYYRVVGKH